ncbi:MAG TPA: methyltransferase domain-containing protein [Gemmataceae bacterium]|nr:methyltransferase domain-containing protein [Gemmataceae bacterium]
MSDPTDVPASSYIHGTAATEQHRLSKLNDLINEASLRELRLRGGENILDVGSGLGQFTRVLARAAGPGARVVGIEKDAQQLAEAVRQARASGEESLVDLRSGDALALPLRTEEWGDFDVAHARFVLEHVRDPLGVVRSMVRAVKFGGRIVLEDDDHEVIRLWPEPPGFALLWHAYIRTYDRLGNDAYVGRRLVSLLHEAGAVPVRNAWIFFGDCASGRSFDAVAQNMIGILQGARATILAQGILDRAYFDGALETLDAWARRPDAALWYAICWAEGIRQS